MSFSNRSRFLVSAPALFGTTKKDIARVHHPLRSLVFATALLGSVLGRTRRPTGGASSLVRRRVTSRSLYMGSEYGSPRRSIYSLPRSQEGAAVLHSPNLSTGMNLR